jgi:predicted hotdog family 3-hydroxylacyl-ACP dehydratase
MVLLDGARDLTADSCQGWLQVNPQAWYARPDGSMPAWFGLEVMAQTIAVYSGATGLQKDEPVRIGYLLGTQAYTCAVDAFPAGTLLETRVDLDYQDDSGLVAFRCELQAQGSPVAACVLKLFRQP